MQNIDELEAFLLKHGENIVDLLGGEIDRIEVKLKVKLINNKINSQSLSRIRLICVDFSFTEKTS